MIRYLFIFLFSIINPACYSNESYSKPLNNVSQNNIYIFVLNIEDCVTCLDNAYRLASLMINNKISKEKIVFLIKEKRKIVCENYVVKLRNIIDLDKLTILWNTSLLEQIGRSVNISGDISTLLIFDFTKSKYILNMQVKLVSPTTLYPYMN